MNNQNPFSKEKIMVPETIFYTHKQTPFIWSDLKHLKFDDNERLANYSTKNL